jgi:transposase
VISFETFHQIRLLQQQEKLSAEQIAQRLGLDVKTVRKWLRKKRYQPRQKPLRQSLTKLDPYKDLILAWLEKHPFTGAQIFERLRCEHGYSGGKTILNDFIAKVRPARHAAYLKLAFEPADCMQVDWGTHGTLRIGESSRKLHYFCAVLCHSRMLFVEFYLSQSMECFLNAHRNALEYFGASPRRIMHDNLKTAVLERRPGEDPRFNPQYLDFAAHYGFKPVACNVARGNEKGRVENAIGYIQKNLLNGLEIHSLAALNAEARRWMEQTANLRLHRASGRRPCDLFALEKEQMQPLPALGYDITRSSRVRATNRCMVHFEANRYSVPFEYAGMFLELRAHPDTVSIYRGEQCIARHVRSYGREVDVENPDHTSRLLKERRRGEDAAVLARFLALSPAAEAYYQGLTLRTACAMRQVRRIVFLAGIHGRERTAEVLGELLEQGAYGSDYLQNILEYRRDMEPLLGRLHLTRGLEHLEVEIPPADCSHFGPAASNTPTPSESNSQAE